MWRFLPPYDRTNGNNSARLNVTGSILSEDDRHILQLEVNAHSVNWPIDGVSQDSAFQKYSDVRSWYSDHIDRCHFDELCAVSILTRPRSSGKKLMK